MKFVINKQEFIKTLQRIQGIVEKRNTMPILSNVLVEAAKGKVTIMATDLEVFIKDSCPAQISEEGSVTVNARKFFEIIKELPGDTVDISSNKESKVTVKSGKARFNVMGLPSKDFPVFPAVDESTLSSIEHETIRDMINKTAFAVSTDETRYNINGFLLEQDASVLRMVTTDGHRLAFIEKNGAGVKTGEKNSVLLPRKGVMEIKKLLDETAAGSFHLGITQKSAVMKKDDTLISVRLLEGEFPDYKKVVPKDNNRLVVADKSELLSSLKRVSILSTDKIKGVRFRFEDSKLTLFSSSPDLGDATEEMDIDFKGDAVEMAFNARYVIDMLEAIDTDKITIELKDPLSPGIVRPAGIKDYSYIIMPMRL